MIQPDVNKLAEHYAAILKEIGADLHSEGTSNDSTQTSVRTASTK